MQAFWLLLYFLETMVCFRGGYQTQTDVSRQSVEDFRSLPGRAGTAGGAAFKKLVVPWGGLLTEGLLRTIPCA